MSTHFTGQVVALSLFVAAVPPALAAEAPMPIAHKTADYRVIMENGKATSVRIELKKGGEVVLTDFSNKKEDIESENHHFSVANCAQQKCKSTCDYASNVRPSLAIARYATNGKLLWKMSLPKEGDGAIQLLSSGTDDCMSPDQKFLTVEIYFPDGAGNFSTRAMPAVIALEPRGRFVHAKGLGSEKDGIIGWRVGQPATLVVEHDAGVLHDGPPEYVETRFSR